jgi:hypothetical protein
MDEKVSMIIDKYCKPEPNKIEKFGKDYLKTLRGKFNQTTGPG